jgi:hypothetical protein
LAAGGRQGLFEDFAQAQAPEDALQQGQGADVEPSELPDGFA